jgi:hypothetical protein
MEERERMEEREKWALPRVEELNSRFEIASPHGRCSYL